jgi:hypothetical protein
MYDARVQEYFFALLSQFVFSSQTVAFLRTVVSNGTTKASNRAAMFVELREFAIR